MNILHDRLVRYFLKRLRRLQFLDILEAATCASILEVTPLVTGTPEAGQKWQASELGRSLVRHLFASGISDPQNVREDARFADLVDRLIRAMSPVFAHKAMTRKERRFYHQHDYDEPDDPSGTVASPSETGSPDNTSYETGVLLRALADIAGPPSPSSVAVVLLVARAIAGTFANLNDFLVALSGRPKTVRFQSGIPGFERHFGELLDEGVILPFWSIGVDAGEGSGLTSDRSHRRHGKRRRHVLTLSGSGLNDKFHTKTREKVDRALRSNSTPLLLVDERAEAEDSWLAAITDLSFECGHIDRELLIDVLVHATGLDVAAARTAIEEVDVNIEGAGLDDLAIALRPGRLPAHMLKALEALARSRRTDEDDLGEKQRASGSKTASKSGKASANLPVILPEPSVTKRSVTSKPVLAVETLAGFGNARTWALNLKTDVGLWRSGDLLWSDMSTRLLLAGPPGTGKTTFAKALCNSLQLPLVAATVADWLEPGYLGDVLQQMTLTFKLAEQHAPAILFIDEIDNIGSRSSAGDKGRHDDYWASLVNRLLTLLDGLITSEGVIVVGATNRRDKIDPALLRSGRLETQVEIGLPDVPALTQILRHHLGSDLEAVLRSAPPLPSLAGKRVPHATRATQKEKSIRRLSQPGSGGDRP